jgi:hypothetical protein
MFHNVMCIALCVILMNLNHDLAGMNVCMYVRMTELYECRKNVYLFIMKSPTNNLNSSSSNL